MIRHAKYETNSSRTSNRGCLPRRLRHEFWRGTHGHHEFSILYDRRKKLTSLLDPIGITLASETPIDLGRWRAYGAQALPAIIASAMAAGTGAL